MTFKGDNATPGHPSDITSGDKGSGLAVSDQATSRINYSFQTLRGLERRVVPSEPSKRSAEPPQIFTSAALRHRAGGCR